VIMRFKSGEDYVRNLVSEFCPDPNISNTIRLETYFKKAHNLFHEALDFVKMGEEKDPQAYIYLMRFSQLVASLPTHSSYSSKEHTREKQLNRRRVENALLKLEELKPKLIASYNKAIEEEKTKGQQKSTDVTESTNKEKTETDKDKDQDKEKENENENESKVPSTKGNLPSTERWNNLLPSEPSTTTTTTGESGLDGMFNNSGPTPITLPENLVKEFIKCAEKNTKSDIETCGILTGKIDTNGNHKITHVIIPKQNATSNTVYTVSEEELIDVQEKHGLITLGWIHTHPSQTCFLSSVDLHCQLSYQIMLPNAIAIVHAPKDKTLTFSLTKKGLETLSSCNCQGFHRHSVEGLYEEAKHVTTSGKYKAKFIDLRK